MRSSGCTAAAWHVFVAATLMACDSASDSHESACGRVVSSRGWLQACYVMEGVTGATDGADGADAGVEDGGVSPYVSTDVRAEGIVVDVRPYSGGCDAWIGPADPRLDVEAPARAYEIDFGEYRRTVVASWDGGALFEEGDPVTYLASSRQDFWSDGRFIALYDAQGDLVLWAGQGTAPRPHHLDGVEILGFGAVECGEGASCAMRVRVSDGARSVSLGDDDVANLGGYQVVTDAMLGNSHDTYSCGNPFRVGLARLP